MKVRYTSKDGRLTTEVEGDGQRAVFEGIARFQEVFEATTCGKCGNDDVQFVVREDDEKNKYYEYRCRNKDCRARLALGAHKVGNGLYPKRREKGQDGQEGKWLNDNGWVIWNSKTGQNE